MINEIYKDLIKIKGEEAMDIQTKPRTKKKDIMVYGASGFTARFIIQELMNTDFKVVLAGRSKTRIRKNLKNVPENCNYEIFEGEDAFKEIENVRLVMNCAGPFIKCSEAVVKKCIESSTNYMDICGEPSCIRKMWSMNYEASKNNVSIIPACGFDSIIADLGYLRFMELLDSKKSEENIENIDFLQEVNTKNIQPKTTIPDESNDIDIKKGSSKNKEFVNNDFESVSLEENGQFREVTSVIEFSNCKMNYGTWNSLLESFYNSARLKGERKAELINDIGGGKYLSKDNKKTPLKHVIYSNYTKSYWVAFMGSDISVVRHSQKFRKDDNRYAAYMEIGSKWNLFLFYLFFFPVMFLSRYTFFKNLFLRFYKFFSCGIVCKDVSNQQIDSSSFKMTFFTNNGFMKEKDCLENNVLEITGPDPGYKTTPILFVECAKDLLNLESKRQNIVGVFTPSMMFKTDIISKLNDRGIIFQFK